jgi:hypothetical protein
MRGFEESTLWRVSAYERARQESGTSGFARLQGASVLPTTLVSELQHLQREAASNDVLEVVGACLRQQEAALMCLRYGDLVWPITLFPAQMLYHSPRNFSEAGLDELASLKVLAVEPPGVRPPGHAMSERVGAEEHYHALAPLLWAVALHGPRKHLLGEIAGRAAYRYAPSRSLDDSLVAPGALGAALQRLKRESASLRDIALWPGLSVERASRLLNALYLTSGLMVTRTHPAAREEPGRLRRLLGGWR